MRAYLWRIFEMGYRNGKGYNKKDEDRYLNLAIAQGTSAFREGIERAQNPFTHPQISEAWILGWDIAREAHTEQIADPPAVPLVIDTAPSVEFVIIASGPDGH